MATIPSERPRENTTQIARERESENLFSNISARIQEIATKPNEIFSKLSELSQTLRTSILNLRTSETSQDDREEVDISKTFIGQQDSLNNLKVIELLNGLILNAYKDTQRLESIKMDDSTPKNSLLRILKESSPTTLLSGMNLMGILHVATEEDDLNVRDEEGRRINELKKGDKICLTIDDTKKPKVIKAQPSNKDNLFVHVEKPDGTAIGYICAKYVQTNSSKEHYSEMMQKAREAEKQKAELPQLKEQIESSNEYFTKLFREPSEDERKSKSFTQLCNSEPFKSHLQASLPYRINIQQNTAVLDKISDINNTHSEFSEELTRFQKMIRIFENYHMTLKSAQENAEVFDAKQNYAKNKITDIQHDLAINRSVKYPIEKYLNRIRHKQTDWQNLEIRQLEVQNKNNKLVYSLHLFLHTYIVPLTKDQKQSISEPLIRLLESSKASELYESMNKLRTIILENGYDTQNRDPYKNPSFYLTARKASKGTSLTQQPQPQSQPDPTPDPEPTPEPTPEPQPEPTPEPEPEPTPRRRETTEGKLTPAETFTFRGTTLTERISQFEHEINSKRIDAPEALKPEFSGVKLLPSTFELIQKTLLEEIRKPDQKLAYIQDKKIITSLNDASTSSLVITLNLDNTSAQEELEFQNSLRTYFIRTGAARRLSPAPQLKEAITYSENLNTIKRAFEGTNFTQQEISQIINFEKLQEVATNNRKLRQDLENIKHYISGRLSTLIIEPLNCFRSEKIEEYKRKNKETHDKTITIHLGIYNTFSKRYNLYNSENGNYEGSFIEGGQSFTEDSYIKSTNEASPSKRREYFDKFKQFAEKLRGQNDKYSESLKSLHFLSKMPPKSTAQTYIQTFKEIETNKASLGANAQILMHKLVKNYFKSQATITGENIGTIERRSTFQNMKPIYKTMFYLKSGLRNRVTSTDEFSKSLVKVYDALNNKQGLLQNPRSTPKQIITFLKDKFELTELNIKNLYNLQKTLNIRNPILSRLLIGLKYLGGTPEQKVEFIEKLYPTAQKGRENQIKLENGKFKITLIQEYRSDIVDFNLTTFTIKSPSEITYDGSTYELKTNISGNKQWQKQT